MNWQGPVLAMGLACLAVHWSLVLISGCRLLLLLAVGFIISPCCAWERFDNSSGWPG